MLCVMLPVVLYRCRRLLIIEHQELTATIQRAPRITSDHPEATRNDQQPSTARRHAKIFLLPKPFQEQLSRRRVNPPPSVRCITDPPFPRPVLLAIPTGVHVAFSSAFFSTMLVSAASIFNILVLMVMLIIAYGYIGKTQFANVRYQGIYNNDLNFQRFAISVGVLVQCVTLGL